MVSVIDFAFNAYFFFRLEMDVQEILSNIRKNEMAVLHKVDQLRREKDSNKVFNGFRAC